MQSSLNKPMWILLAVVASVSAGFTSVLSKMGGSKIGSNMLTLLRTIVVVMMSWLIVALFGSWGNVGGHSLLFLILSGLATGASWLCYYRALQIGKVAGVVAVDQSSVLFSVILAIIFLGERSKFEIALIGLLIIALGMFFIVLERNKNIDKTVVVKTQRGWIFFAFGSAIFASLTAIFGKIGISGVDSNLGTAIRTLVIIPMALMMVFINHETQDYQKLTGRDILYIVLSGIGTGVSWLCYYAALALGPVTVIAPIDKTSIAVATFLAFLFLREKPSKLTILGLGFIVFGTIVIAF